MPTRPPRMRPLLLAVGLLPIGLAAAELGVRAADSYVGGSLSRPPCPAASAVPCPVARHALPAFGTVAAADPDTGEPRTLLLNSLGLRGNDVAVPKPDGVRRVLLLGDETPFAAGVPDGETFAGLLTPALTAAAERAEPGATAEVVNAAIPCDCPLLSVLRLRTLGALQPDLILLCVRPSDLSEDAAYRRDLLTDADGRAVACPHPAVAAGKPRASTPTLDSWRDSLALRLAVRTFLGPERCPLTGAPLIAAVDPVAGGPAAALAAEQALTPFAELARVAEGLGARAAVIVLPDRLEAGRNGAATSDDEPNAEPSPVVRMILDAASAAGLRTFHAAAALTGPSGAGETGPSMTSGGELTRAGHVRLAEALAGFLLSAPRSEPSTSASASAAAGG